jgi:NAD-dependent SIR2 family protein deacetylase
VDGKLPLIGYAYLVDLVNKGHLYAFFTTNFDDLLQEAFYQFSGKRPIMCAHESSVQSISITSTRPKIIKLHGDYLFDDIKSTLRETKSLEQNIKESFEAWKINYTYALKEKNIQYSDVTIRNMSAHSTNESIKLAAFAILGNIDTVERMVRSEIN